MSKFKILGLLTFLLVLPALGLAQKQSKVPVLNAISPTSATAGGSSLTLTASGSNFTSGSVVQWNGSSIATTVVSSTQLQASVASSRIAGAGTATVKVYTSGRFGGTSNGLTFTTNPAPAAPPPAPPPPPPSPSPLAITTSSVPGGTSGAAYNTPLAASGGTLAYGWSKVSGGGDLPPGLALGADGKLSGTPTTAGTYSFTVQANDSSSTQQTAQKVFSLTVAAAPTTTGYLFQSGFETGDFSEWNAHYQDPPVTTGSTLMYRYNKDDISSNPSLVHSGSYSAVQTYTICSDQTNAQCGYAIQDSGQLFEKDFTSSNGYPNGLNHFFLRGYVYFHVNSGGTAKGSANPMGRKIYYINPPAVSPHWSVILGAWDMTLAIGLESDRTCSTGEWAWTNLYTMNFDTWYSIETEVLVNSSGNSDGALRVWVNGSQVFEQTGLGAPGALNMAGTCGNGVTSIQIGRQANRYNWDPVNEVRYWDDVVISTSYIGP